MTCGVLLSATADFVALFVQAGSALPCSAPVTTIVDSSANAGACSASVMAPARAQSVKREGVIMSSCCQMQYGTTIIIIYINKSILR